MADLPAVVAAHEARLRAAQDEGRQWLELLSLRQLSRYVREVAEELEGTAPEAFAADVEALLQSGVADLGMNVASLPATDHSDLVARLAAVHMAIDQEDLAYARDLLGRRRNAGLDSIVGEIVEKL